MQPPVVILVETSHPGNVGAAARGAANFGVTDMRFVRPRCDVQGDEAMARAVHAKSLLENGRICDTLEEALEGTGLSVGTTARSNQAENRYLRKPLDVRDWLEDIGQVETSHAFVFGPEDTGLRAEHVNLLDQLVTVPTADYASLNLAHAVTLLSYEHHRLRDQERITPPRELAPDTLRHLHKVFDDLTDACEPRAWRREVAKGIWRKVMGRSLPADHEVHNLMGIFSNAMRRFDHPDYASDKSKEVLARRGLLAVPVDEEE